MIKTIKGRSRDGFIVYVGNTGLSQIIGGKRTFSKKKKDKDWLVANSISAQRPGHRPAQRPKYFSPPLRLGAFSIPRCDFVPH